MKAGSDKSIKPYLRVVDETRISLMSTVLYRKLFSKLENAFKRRTEYSL